MPRPAKSVNLSSKHLTAAEITARSDAESMLCGSAGKVKPFAHLTPEQIGIFKFIVGELKASGVVCNLDVYILNRCAVAIDRLNTLDAMANRDGSLLLDNDFLKARKEYAADFNKCCSELCLSPQSRAKVGTINAAKKAEGSDPLIKALGSG